MSTFIKKLLFWEEKLVKFEETIIGFAVIIIVLSVFLNVVGRHYAGFVPTGLNELARYIVAYIVLIGSAVGIHKKSHITGGNLKNIIKGEKAFVYVNLIINCVILIYFCFFSLWCWQLWLGSLQAGAKTHQLQLPLSLFHAAMPVGSTLFIFHGLLLILRDYKKFKSGLQL